MRFKVYKDQSTKLCDTSSLPDGMTVVLQAQAATPVFIDQERGLLDFVDAGGNPTGGWFLTNAMTPLVLPGFRGQLWARAGQETQIEVNLSRITIGSVPVGFTGNPVRRAR
jgi:hypothetical protein